ncbi:MAG: type II secretion system F family protein [Desulfobulbaceae bacterium]|nr:type II secretion system F family protein [Desulfobulbaceae bacterium]
MIFVLLSAIFSSILLIFEVGYALFGKTQQRSTRKAVEKYASQDKAPKQINLLYIRKLSEIPALDRILSSLPVFLKLDDLLIQSGIKMLVSVFLLTSLTIGAVISLAAYLYTGKMIVVLPITAVVLLIPFVYISSMKERRVQKFMVLFPDTLALMTRSMKAGHSLAAGMKMVADEMPNPINEEFSRIVEEINFGIGIDNVLRQFAARMNHPDVNYFVVAVIIQRETGGNLGEILDNVAANIRKRFRFKDHIRTLTAEGRLSAMVLVAVPFIIALAIYVTNRDYLSVLATDPAGPYIVGIALLLMCFGIFVISRIIKMDV